MYIYGFTIYRSSCNYYICYYILLQLIIFGKKRIFFSFLSVLYGFDIFFFYSLYFFTTSIEISGTIHYTDSNLVHHI